MALNTHRHVAALGEMPGVRGVLVAAAAISFLLVLHNYGLNLFPRETVLIPASRIRPYSTDSRLAFIYDFTGSEPDRVFSARSRVTFCENGRPYPARSARLDDLVRLGGDRYSHLGRQIVFGTTDHSDPRTNGRRYSLQTPRWYHPVIGLSSALVLAASIAGLWATGRGRNAASHRSYDGDHVSRWHWHLWGATALFALGLYCNTGSLAPYGNTYFPVVDPDTGYVYNADHVHFRLLFDFIDGAERSAWDHGIMLRRILFPVLGWPLMKLFGFEIGGTLTSLAVNVGGFAAILGLMRRRVGERGAIFGGWMLALYPGAAYWAGLPYPYALIFPASLLLMFGLLGLSEVAGWRFLALSLAMGLAYLGYDLALYFIPATILTLIVRRRFIAAATSAVVQAIPGALWAWILVHRLGQPLENSNTTTYRSALMAYFQPADHARWWREIMAAPGLGLDAFFAANFIFIPGLFLGVLVLNPLTARIRFRMEEAALLLTGLALFLFLNLAPDYASGGWVMRGTWVSRLYQPVLPALILYLARWWQALPPLSGRLRLVIGGALAGVTLGDALIVFGPILNNPFQVSEFAFYRFYNHTEAHWIYAASLKDLRRRPLGFPEAHRTEPTPEENLAAARRRFAAETVELERARKDYTTLAAALANNRAALAQIEAADRAVVRELMAAQNAAVARAESKGSAQSPLGREAAPEPSLPAVGAGLRGIEQALRDTDRALSAGNHELIALEQSIVATQRRMLSHQAELTSLRGRGGNAQPQPSSAR